MGREAREMISFLADALESQSKASSNVAFKASCGSASDFLLLPPHDSNAISSRVNFNFLVFPTRARVLVVEKVNARLTQSLRECLRLDRAEDEDEYVK